MPLLLTVANNICKFLAVDDNFLSPPDSTRCRRHSPTLSTFKAVPTSVITKMLPFVLFFVLNAVALESEVF